MGVASKITPGEATASRIYDILADRRHPLQSHPSGPAFGPPIDTMLHRIQQYSGGHGVANIDISGPDFDFVRSIRVFNVTARQRLQGSQEDCVRHANVRMGVYGTQGNFSWHDVGVGSVPRAFVGLGKYGQNCPAVSVRAVFVEWRDYEQNYGFEQVNY
ncbi:hypothetical protein [Ruegeria atlantica]|uniref:hypothetical protein n=1 Tax=Ruegeria atlantica TaxID=81569 RepID=UPI0020C42719|nr:hypothetical protein [Ruegeria atlantica]